MNEMRGSNFLEVERQDTDDSLTAERTKTNESLNEARAAAENLTNKVVIAERHKADVITNSSRTKADKSRELSRQILSADAQSDHDSTQLQKERSTVDQAIEQERSQIDAALIEERYLKDQVVTRILDEEREKTNESLLVERTRTDAEVHDNFALLSEEIAEHLKTKTSLTSRGELLAIVSHDLRNPMGAISSCAEMLLEDTSFKALDAETRTWIEFIKRSSDAALRLISDLLDMERGAQGKLQVHFALHDVGKILRESIEDFTLQAAAKSILLRQLPSDISGEIVCDRDRIMQVISNLIGNAIKFTPEGGTITVNANFNETELQVSVRDTGSGIPKEKLATIFQRFEQLAPNDRRGLGLGLHISKMLVEAHHGRLWVQSRVGEGSAFFFALPKKEFLIRH